MKNIVKRFKEKYFPDMTSYFCASLPNHVQIEITARCNLRCYMCPRETLGFKDRDLADINLDNFKTIIDKLPDGIDIISLHGLGEPLLNKDVFQMISYAGKRFNVLLVTNGTLLNEHKVTNLLGAEPKQIIISIDSPYKEDYEAIRKGAKFDTVLKNIELIEQLRKKTSPDVKFSLQMTVSEENFNQIHDMIDLCKSLGVENLSLIGIHTYKNDKIIDILPDYEAKIKKIKDYAEKKFIGLTLISMENNNKSLLCERPYKTLFINSDGLVNPCCIHETQERQVVGNIYESNFEAIWNGDLMNKFRKDLSSEKKPSMCSHCDRLYS